MSPEVQSLLIFLLTGLVAGWIASLVLGYVLKFAGVTLPIGNAWVSDLATAVIGALIVIVIARIIAR
jgi:uncharacterized membrane protein YeaQ/YmgE (transglycosylase-associated protein family)